jgi:hypothetical protein
MWQAKDIKYNGDNSEGVIGVSVFFESDNGRKATIDNRVSDPDSIKQIITNSLVEFERKDKLAEFLKNPPALEEIMKTEEPTVDENKEYNDKKQQLVQAKTDMDLGLITQREYDSLLDEVVALKP